MVAVKRTRANRLTSEIAKRDRAVDKQEQERLTALRTKTEKLKALRLEKAADEPAGGKKR